MVEIRDKYSIEIRQYCVFNNIDTKDFIEKMCEENQELKEFRIKIQKLKFS